MTANRLAGETSPYLRQHAHNPVDWFPWGDEALRRARELDRPIFLSVGYAACHWCHVMERESFEDPAIARLLNDSFVSIKVDREERPDIDELYMNAVQALTGSGGWPMSVWLTPDLRPFYAGTYFPPRDHWGRPAFPTVLTELARAYRERRPEIERVADQVAQALQEMAGGGPASALPDREAVENAVRSLQARFDPLYGGFGPAPKFPPHAGLALLLRRQRQEPDLELLRMAVLTLDRMAQGGLYEQVGGGFHRYSTDREWLVPHFEKMLYDNALLVPVYLDAWEITGSALYRRVVTETLDWALREMAGPEGGFFSTIDADSEGEEGRFTLWTPEEVAGVLSAEEGGLFSRIYDITPAGNFEGRSIPHLARPIEEWAGELGVAPAELESRLVAMREKLRQARDRRPRPAVDDKVLAGWNGLMLSALARAGRVLGDAGYTAAAERTAGFLWSALRPEGRLLHTWRAGRAKIPAFQDDYAFLARGLLDLFDATGDAQWRSHAGALAGEMLDLFWDEAAGGFFFTARDQEIPIARSKNPYDGALPSGNAVAVEVLLRLAALEGDAGLEAKARRTLAAFGEQMQHSPDAFLEMIRHLDEYLDARRPAALPDVVRLEAAPEGALPAGGSTRLLVRLHVADGWHVNAHHPSEEHLIPTEIALTAPPGIRAGEVRYPPPQSFQPEFAEAPLAVYQGTVEAAVELQADAAASPGDVTVTVRASYQACDAARCLAPAQATAEAIVRVGGMHPAPSGGRGGAKDG